MVFGEMSRGVSRSITPGESQRFPIEAPSKELLGEPLPGKWEGDTAEEGDENRKPFRLVREVKFSCGRYALRADDNRQDRGGEGRRGEVSCRLGVGICLINRTMPELMIIRLLSRSPSRNIVSLVLNWRTSTFSANAFNLL